MKKAIGFSSVLLVFSVVLLLTDCTGKRKSTADQKTVPDSGQLVARGEYLVTIMGCQDCHSPKRPGPQGPAVVTELMLSGYHDGFPKPVVNTGMIKQGMVIFNPDLTASAGPWGMSFAANLTSDQSGVGSWTRENFARALREGKYMGLSESRMLLPPMPWTNFGNLQDEDINAIFAYLRSIHPVRNVVPLPVPPQDLKDD